MARRQLATVMLAPLAALSLTACGINSIPTAEEEVKGRWADVENQYQRRADLIPNLVSTVKGFANQESEVLTQVTEARSRASSIQVDPDDLDNPQALQQFGAAQGELDSALSRLLVTVEAYPQLTSNQNFLALQSQLEGTENRISIARRDYNQAVQEYNTLIRTFPAVIGANIFYGAEPKATFEATTPDAQVAPTVDFGNSQ
ncbi:LemA family protein [Allosphingosinicella sp.]|uniref:LemA family protein n=1 Tax=Allosphingosinicella sp. TaxID=2823234 RepID=UPI002FC22A82